MNILIVDDDAYVLDLICKKMDWSASMRFTRRRAQSRQKK